ncbi:ABC transporter ATP-binding protein [Candidatus Chloroploca sp. M-50]|uniref:ABC transporter ATP-binding protein n=1 Tax=Candidatus Chloroploca mongolica TaxID=2528176 RepID=A0ABS4DGF9_9CHLR|nr:ABC transporter ATP-binding protein [Candidatus Chloroploca mongolica]
MSETTPKPVAKDPRRRKGGADSDERIELVPTLRRLLSYVVHRRARFILVIVLLITSVLLSALLPYLMGRAVDLIGARGDLDELARIALTIAGAAALYWICAWQSNRNIQFLAQDALFRLRTELFDHIQTLSLNFYDRQPIGEIMSRATNDIDTIDNFFSRGLNQLLTATMTIVVIVTVMFILNVTLAVITLVTMPIMLGVALFMGRIAGPAFAQLQAKLSDANGFMEEALAGNKTILAYGQQRQSGDSLEDLSVGVRDTGAKAMLAALSVTPIVNVAQNSQQAIIALVGSIMAIQGEFGFGTVLTFITYSGQLQSPVQQLGQIYNTILQAAAGAARVFAILDEGPTVQDAPRAQDLQLKGGHVVFTDVDFSYVKGRKILRGNSFEALPGQKIGLCGPTGAGKSTIINILTRYYDVDSGTITIDGQNIATLSQASLRQQIGAVLQEAFLFSDTVMNNLKYAREGATDEECIAAAKEANAHDFIMQLPQGYDTMLTERGANLSQGQRQMLTIARAMVANPKMLILDEATSNVDTRTEKLIQEGLLRLMEGKTSFVIAHRLSTIRDSARILAIKDGVIVEQGTHEELMAHKGLYYDLYMTQFRVRPEAATG